MVRLAGACVESNDGRESAEPVGRGAASHRNQVRQFATLVNGQRQAKRASWTGYCGCGAAGAEVNHLVSEGCPGPPDRAARSCGCVHRFSGFVGSTAVSTGEHRHVTDHRESIGKTVVFGWSGGGRVCR